MSKTVHQPCPVCGGRTIHKWTGYRKCAACGTVVFRYKSKLARRATRFVYKRKEVKRDE